MNYADSAARLVRQTVTRDAAGARLFRGDDAHWRWFDEVVTDPRKEPAWDSFTAIAGFNIMGARVVNDTAEIAVRYRVVDLVVPVFRDTVLSGWQLSGHQDTVIQRVLRVVRLSGHLRIVSPLPSPLVLAKCVLSRRDKPLILHADSVRLAAVASASGSACF
jgi:hypothetical protein